MFAGVTRTALVSPVSLEEMHDYLRIDTDDLDDLIQAQLIAATDLFETRTRMATASATFTLTLDAFPISRAIQLWPVPLVSVASVKYDDEEGDEQTMSPDLYYVDTSNRPGRLRLRQDADWPVTSEDPGCIRVTFTAGHATVPEGAKQAIKAIAASWFRHAEAVSDRTWSELPLSVQALIDAYRFPRAY